MLQVTLREQLALLVEQMPASIAIVDTEACFLAASRRYMAACEALFSVRLPPPSEVVGRSIFEVFPALPLRWREALTRVLAGEELAEQEDFLPHQDGSTVFLRWSLNPWRTANGEIGGALGFVELITAQVTAKRALAESEARFRATFENAAVGIAHISSDGRWLRANNALCRILGWPIDELLTKSIRDISHPADFEVDLAYLEQLRAGTIDSYNMDKRYLRKDGAIVWGRLTVGCVRRTERSIDYVVAVVEDITARKRAEEELIKSEERFKSSILRSPVPAVLYDDRQRILATSESWLKKAGVVSAAEFQRVEDWAKYFFGEDPDEMLKLTRATGATEPDGRSAELTLSVGGEKRIWNFVTSGLGAQSDGRRHFVVMAADVTDHRAYEERIQLLLREACHRTNNILSLVLAIARQTTAIDPQDFIGRFTERIKALAANQDLLVRHEWHRIDVKDLVRNQLGHFADLIGTRINFAGPKLLLNANAAQTIGLALHELATNSGKYGALSTDKGLVDVCWNLGNDAYTMGWIERDGPCVRPPERRGFGSTVIESMVEKDLHGEVRLDYAPSGLQWRLTCRAGDALEG